MAKNKASYKLKDYKYLRFKIEYLYENKKRWVFIYIDKIGQFINLYNFTNKDDCKFYEIINDKCKFFLKFYSKYYINYKIWNENIEIIKNELKIFFKKNINKNIEILDYNTYKKDENKYLCYLMILGYCFKSEECENICNLFLNELNNKKINIVNIIKNKIYGKNKMLIIENDIKLNDLITNIENTELLLYDDILKIKTGVMGLNSLSLVFQENENKDFQIPNLESCVTIRDVEKKIINCFYCNNVVETQEEICINCIKNKKTTNDEFYKINFKKYINEIISKHLHESIIFNIVNKIKTSYVNTEQNLNNYGYLYVIKLREFIKMNENIYKIGCTKDVIRRYKQYPKDSKLIYTIIHYDYKNIEKKWIKKLDNNKKLIKCNNIGKEYYEGDYNLIINELTMLLNKNK